MALLGGLALTSIACSDEGETLIGYDILVEFRYNYTEADVGEVTAFLQTFDPDGDFSIQESFPPTLRASVTVAGTDFCEAAEPELSGRPYAASVRCVTTHGLSSLQQTVIA